MDGAQDAQDSRSPPSITRSLPVRNPLPPAASETMSATNLPIVSAVANLRCGKPSNQPTSPVRFSMLTVRWVYDPATP